MSTMSTIIGAGIGAAAGWFRGGAKGAALGAGVGGVAGYASDTIVSMLSPAVGAPEPLPVDPVLLPDVEVSPDPVVIDIEPDTVPVDIVPVDIVPVIPSTSPGSRTLRPSDPAPVKPRKPTIAEYDMDGDGKINRGFLGFGTGESAAYGSAIRKYNLAMVHYSRDFAAWKARQ